MIKIVTNSSYLKVEKEVNQLLTQGWTVLSTHATHLDMLDAHTTFTVYLTDMPVNRYVGNDVAIGRSNENAKAVPLPILPVQPVEIPLGSTGPYGKY